MKVPEPRKMTSGNWFIQLRLGGQSIPVTAATKKECIRQAELIKAEHRNGKREALSDKITLAHALDEYIDKRRNVLSPSTIYGYLTIKKTRFQSYMEKDINGVDWQKAVNAEALLCSPKTLKNAWGLVKAVLAENGITANVKLPALEKKEKAWLDSQEIKAFLNAAKDKPGEMGALLALSSLRKSEIYGLDWSDIDLEHNVIHVHSSRVMGEGAVLVTRSKNKTAASTRDVPIFLPRLRELLEATEKKEGSVMTCAIGTLYDQIQTICKNANLPAVGVHGLRHSFASLCYSLGISELGAMQIGGWSDYQTMRKIYTHLSESERQASANKLADFFKNAN